MDIILFQDLGALFVQVVVYPIRRRPVFLRNELVVAFRLCESLCTAFKLFGEGNIIEEGPRIIELVVPAFFELLDGREKLMKFLVADE